MKEKNQILLCYHYILTFFYFFSLWVCPCMCEWVSMYLCVFMCVCMCICVYIPISLSVCGGQSTILMSQFTWVHGMELRFSLGVKSLEPLSHLLIPHSILIHMNVQISQQHFWRCYLVCNIGSWCICQNKRVDVCVWTYV